MATKPEEKPDDSAILKIAQVLQQMTNRLDRLELSMSQQAESSKKSQAKGNDDAEYEFDSSTRRG